MQMRRLVRAFAAAHAQSIVVMKTRANFRPPAPLLTSASAFKGGLCAYAISSQISLTGSFKHLTDQRNASTTSMSESSE